MAGINLFKIDIQKIDTFNEILKEFNCIGVDELEDEEINYLFNLYISTSKEKKSLGWDWIFREFGEEAEQVDSIPSGIVTILRNDIMYAISFGHAFFKIDKCCDKNFAFNYAKRVDYNEIKTTTLLSPHSRRNKTISTFVDYTELEFESGESYSKIKIKTNEMKDLFSPSIEIGTSIKFNLKHPSLNSIIELIKYVEEVLEKNIKNNIPLFLKIKDEEKIQLLETKLYDKVLKDVESLNISELDIIGATEIFNRNDGQFLIKSGDVEKEIFALSINEIEVFCKENNLSFEENFSNIKIISIFNGEKVRTDSIHDLIDYTDDEAKCLLSKGIWYEYNDDYLKYLDDSIAEIECIYNPDYDFTKTLHQEFIDLKYIQEKNNPEYKDYTEEQIKKALKNKYYTERVFNILREEDGFLNYDREIDSSKGMKFELMDLYKEETMYAVKVGSGSAKLCYAVDQSLSSVKMYKHGKLNGMPNVTRVALWFVLDKKINLKQTASGNPDLTELNMLLLKNRIDDWKKEVRLLGYTPQIYINYIR